VIETMERLGVLRARGVGGMEEQHENEKLWEEIAKLRSDASSPSYSPVGAARALVMRMMIMMMMMRRRRMRRMRRRMRRRRRLGIMMNHSHIRMRGPAVDQVDLESWDSSNSCVVTQGQARDLC
jgi:hypothetical protein